MKWHCLEHTNWTTDSPFEAQKHRFKKHRDEFGRGGKGSVIHTGPANGPWANRAPSRGLPDFVEQVKAEKKPDRPEPDYHVPSEGSQVRARGKSDAAKVIRRGE